MGSWMVARNRCLLARSHTTAAWVSRSRLRSCSRRRLLMSWTCCSCDWTSIWTQLTNFKTHLLRALDKNNIQLCNPEMHTHTRSNQRNLRKAPSKERKWAHSGTLLVFYFFKYHRPLTLYVRFFWFCYYLISIQLDLPFIDTLPRLYNRSSYITYNH